MYWVCLVIDMLNLKTIIVNETDFFKEFHRRNHTIYSPKKDLCNLCEGYKYDHISQEVYDRSILFIFSKYSSFIICDILAPPIIILSETSVLFPNIVSQ